MAWGFELPNCSFISLCKGSCWNAQLESIVGKRSGSRIISHFFQKAIHLTTIFKVIKLFPKGRRFLVGIDNALFLLMLYFIFFIWRSWWRKILCVLEKDMILLFYKLFLICGPNILFLNKQLRIEQRCGRVFEGWTEGRIYFPPTYKYSNNSDRYAGDDTNPKEKRRTPAWSKLGLPFFSLRELEKILQLFTLTEEADEACLHCRCDRILWFGRGLQQLSYVRGESKFSDHRPVYSIFTAEVESINHSRIQNLGCSSSGVDIEELLPYSHGYTELSFFWKVQWNKVYIQMDCSTPFDQRKVFFAPHMFPMILNKN